MKKWNQTNAQIAAIIAAGQGDLLIVSGEGDCGTEEDYHGAQTVSAIKMRLKKERCGGDRWAWVDTYDGHAINHMI